MARRKPSPIELTGMVAEILRNAKLFWKLLRDKRIPPWLKLIPLATVLYLFLPIDLFSDYLFGLGQLDDLAIILLGIKLFIKLCPKDVVQQHLREIGSVPGSYNRVQEETTYIDVPYRIIEDEKD